MVSRRKFLQSSAALSTMAALPLSVRWHIAQAATAAAGLSDPALQPKFLNAVPDALSPGFIYDTRRGKAKVTLGPSVQQTGLIDTAANSPVGAVALRQAENDPRRLTLVGIEMDDPARAAKRLGWSAQRDLDAMCRDAWAWQSYLAGRNSGK